MCIQKYSNNKPLSQNVSTSFYGKTYSYYKYSDETSVQSSKLPLQYFIPDGLAVGLPYGYFFFPYCNSISMNSFNFFYRYDE